MSGMHEKFVRTHRMLPDSGLVLCAVSGGKDSMCLLFWLRELSKKYGYTVAAAHFNHMLRPQTAERDEVFVREYCAALDIPFYAGRGDTAAHAKSTGQSIEEAARNLRYAFLLDTAAKTGALRVATAHHLGDNAETVLMHLIRGTGLTGLSGIAPVRDIFIRPLLDTPRSEIESYLQLHHIPHIEDETNAELRYTRNRIRHTLMPALREFNPRIEETLCAAAEHLRRDEAYLRQVTRRVCASVVREGDGVRIERAELTQLPPALQGRVVRHMLDLLEVSKKDIAARHIAAVLELAERSGPSAQLSLPRGIIARNEERFFCLTRKWQGEWTAAELAPVCDVYSGPWRVKCRVLPHGGAVEGERRLILNNDAVDGAVFVGKWQEKSRMTLPGSEGSRSLKRLFLDARIDLQKREEIPVIYIGGAAAAVLGIGIEKKYIKKEGSWQYVIEFEKR